MLEDDVAEAGSALAASADGGATVEMVVNMTGYSCINAGDPESAHAVLRLNTELFPRSANTWDSLGEAYMTKGDTERAIANYEKSLELNPDNEGAKHMLRTLRGGADR